MKKINGLITLIPIILLNLQLFAQDKKVDVDIEVNKKDGGDWYMQPWVWVIGAAVFIIIIVALLSGRKKE